jgi:hypothetical protein
MWFFLAPAPPPDARPWPGRRWLAAVDAIAWPAMWIGAASILPAPGGIVEALAYAVAALAGWRRLQRALLFNHRYHFTTWAWGCRLGKLLLVGALMWLTLIA